MGSGLVLAAEPQIRLFRYHDERSTQTSGGNVTTDDGG
jgi:hypothetical protein